MQTNINEEYKLKKFFMRLYKPIIESGNNLKSEEQIVIAYKYEFEDNESGTEKTAFITEGYNNIDDLVKGVLKNKRTKYADCYFNLSTSNKNDRKSENMQTRTCIGIDFDNGSLTVNELQKIFCKHKLFYNAIVHSGHGLHVYIFIEPTKDLKLVQDVTKKIIELTGADNSANTSTQLLRVPFTKNFKHKEDVKKVKLYHLEEEDTIKRKDINTIAKKLFAQNAKSKTFKFNLKCKRAENLISNGSNKHEKHNDLLFLYSKLKQMKLDDDQLQLALDKWNDKSNYSDYEYQVADLKSRETFKISCGNCEHKNDCFSVIENDFEYHERESLISANEKIFSRCKRKGAKQMNGNMLVVYGLLKLHSKGLTKDEMIEEMTFKNKRKKVINTAMGERTLRTTLKAMEEQNFVKVSLIGRKKLYQLSDEKSEDQLRFLVRASVVFDVIKGYMTQEELQFYCFLRYLQNEQRRLEPNITGNKFVMTQAEIANKYGVTRKCVNELIGELERKKYIRKEYRQSKTNGFEYCNYYLVH